MTEPSPPAGGGRLARELAAGLQELGEPAGDEIVAKLARLLTELERWNRRINLTAVRDLHDMVALHVQDSLAVRPLLIGPRVLDVGTGAGFPGLPLAIVAPGLAFTLLDSNGKKISFVRHMIGDLGLGNATAVRARVEDYAPATAFDTVIARAFAPLPRMLELAGHLVAGDGVLLALKGKYPAAELAGLRAAEPAWTTDVTELTVPGLPDHERHVVRLTRRGAVHR